MATYKCTNSFKSVNGKSYQYGDRIQQLEFRSLNHMEQRNFTMYVTEDTTDNGYTPPILTPDITDFGLGSFGSFGSFGSSDSGSESSGSNDFGGGDFGGGGASGDF